MTYPKEEEKLFRIFHLFKDSGLGIFQVLQTKSPLYFSFCIWFFDWWICVLLGLNLGRTTSMGLGLDAEYVLFGQFSVFHQQH